MTKRLKIASIGEAMIELRGNQEPSKSDDSLNTGVSGDALNMAVYLKRSAGEQMDVSFITMIGMDPLSAKIKSFIEKEGILTDKIGYHPSKLPGIYLIETDSQGERKFFFWRENSAARTLFHDGFDKLQGFDVIYFSAISLAILPPFIRDAFLAYLAAFKGKVVFDSNYRPRLWEDPQTARLAIEKAWRVTDIAMPSLDDEMALFGDQDEAQVLARLQSYGITQGVLKRGEKGPIPIGITEFQAIAYPKAAKVVDTTAAGDSFVGAYLAASLLGEGQAESMMKAHLMALKVIAHHGAII